MVIVAVAVATAGREAAAGERGRDEEQEEEEEEEEERGEEGEVVAEEEQLVGAVRAGRVLVDGAAVARDRLIYTVCNVGITPCRALAFNHCFCHCICSIRRSIS